ncbi:hypothetical protein HII31_03529 [Pseudocercospora fuligena]|uniref:Fe2OG dioxygenase domain-containing protein n=1 Tax=Pseudocercospora fuligena TaxID=685502 RepID=A0A8H6RMG9_9PEZI|nr:hypothetical protein HII31_03529 [Pseudocercospora fuligena]
MGLSEACFALHFIIRNAMPHSDSIKDPPLIFDPVLHLAFTPPKARYSFTELGLAKPHNAPDTCYTEPFQLFSEECIRLMRRELFQKEFLDKWMRTWDRAPCYIGGFSADDCEDADFIKQAWYHPATQAAINQAFGTALKPVRRHCDVGYVNVQLGPDGRDGVYKYTEFPSPPKTESEEKSLWDEVPIDAWHKDQVPVVCVMMLSDTSSMDGGETAVRLGNGKVVKARGAGLGGAVLMQSGTLEHAAMRASNCAERLSMVTSFSFADPDLDDSRLTLKTADYVNEDMAALRLAHLDYKLNRLRDRVELALHRANKARKERAEPDRGEIDAWVKEQILFLKQMSWELFEREPNYVGKEVPDDVFRAYLSGD